jgi:RNA polymerase sigma-70 factor (ECF subfamily)
MGDGESVVRAIAVARAAWPGVALDDAVFHSALARGLDGRGELAIDDLHTRDLYLAQACAAGDEQALAQFDRQLLGLVPQFLSRHPARGRSDEVRQLLRERLLVSGDGAPPRIAGYSGRGALADWLRVAALRVASNLVRADRPTRELDDDIAAAALTDAPELRVLEARYQRAFRAAFRAAFAALSPVERTLLRLHFVDGITVRKLVPLVGGSPATAGRRLLAAQRRLGEAVLAELSASMATPVGELASIVRTLLSRLEVSLTALAG